MKTKVATTGYVSHTNSYANLIGQSKKPSINFRTVNHSVNSSQDASESGYKPYDLNTNSRVRSLQRLAAESLKFSVDHLTKKQDLQPIKFD